VGLVEAVRLVIAMSTSSGQKTRSAALLLFDFSMALNIACGSVHEMRPGMPAKVNRMFLFETSPDSGESLSRQLETPPCGVFGGVGFAADEE
jgi:hypothetical protein